MRIVEAAKRERGGAARGAPNLPVVSEARAERRRDVVDRMIRRLRDRPRPQGNTRSWLLALAGVLFVGAMVLAIETLPDGYQTALRERGADLSAAQRQLLSFARAVAHGSDVLVLDEATSSIDTETETLIQRGIHNLMEGKTAIVVAHRFSTIQDVDRIYVLHKGRIVESGSHDDLIGLEGVYYRLYRLQHRSEQAHAAAS